MKKLKENIYSVGAINPNLRVFDIIMQTEFGTSYNSYLVTGDKIALVETIHDKFTKALFDNIGEVTDIEKIDYIIMNHTEPDHSGSIAKLIEINPNIVIIGSAAAIKNVGNITNMEFNSRVVKTGDKLDLGQGLEMEFIISPNLHWPDSMFTYLPARKTVFTCDFLGAHYCEPFMTDDEITYPDAYEKAFENYYNAIFGPFKKFVLAGLDNLSPLDFDMVCTSHGPVLKNSYKRAIELYRGWSTPKPVEKNIAIFYVSAYGYTRSMAHAFEKELCAIGIPTKTYDIIHHDSAEIKEAFENASGVLIGSPTINRDALKPVWDMLSSVDAVTNRGKSCMVFGSYGWSGEGCAMLQERAKSLGLKIAADFFRVVMKPSQADFDTIKLMAGQFSATVQ